VGPRTLTADYVIAADGCRSPLRARLGLDFEGRTFADNFLIADGRMPAPFPAERRFYFNAPFNRGRTALMHQQLDDVWRLDFQLGWDINRDAALADTNVAARVEAILGPGIACDYQ
jgi:3-(3-hydroxy-phenyl)propionate hydroxylase